VTPHNPILYRFEIELCGDRDGVAQGTVDRTAFGVHAVDPLHRSPVLLVRLEPHPHVDALDHEDTFLFLDFTDGLCYQPVNRRRDLTRLQRASKGSGESTGGRGDDVVERRRMGREGIRRYLIVFGDGSVNSEDHRLRFRGQVSAPHRAFLSLDADFRSIDYVSHFATIAL
jgi:hypothetical protein